MKPSKRDIPLSKKLGALGAAVGYFALFFAMQITMQLLVSIIWGIMLVLEGVVSTNALEDALSAEIVDLMLLSTIIGNLLSVLVCFLFMRVRKKSFANEVGWHKMGRVDYRLSDLTAPVVMGFALSVLCSVALILVTNAFPFMQKALETYAEQTAVFTDGDAALTFITTVIIAPLAEELIFRGLIYTRLRRAFSRLSSILATSLLFGLAHGTFIHMLYTVPLSILLCIIYDRFRSLWAPILLHFGFNLAGTIMVYFTVIPFWFVGVCLALTAYGICILCTYRTPIADHIWKITVELSLPKVPIVSRAIPIQESKETEDSYETN